MNRYESAYRDYTTQRDVDDFPQRPERKMRTAERALPRLDSSSVESNSYEQQQQARAAHQQQQQYGFTSDEENYHAAHPISSRELFDRGGERGNPEFIITTDAIQRYARYQSISIQCPIHDTFTWLTELLFSRWSRGRVESWELSTSMK